MSNHLVIGLGATGGDVVRALRQRIWNEFLDITPSNDTHFDYLYVDSSPQRLRDSTSWFPEGLSEDQRLSIHDIYPDLTTNLEAHPNIARFLSPQELPIVMSDEGKQSRRFGRVRMACHTQQLMENIRHRMNNVFHICADLGDATGSGALIEVLAQLRIEYPQKAIYLYLRLPRSSESLRAQSNAYAALLELNAMSAQCYMPYDVCVFAFFNGACLYTDTADSVADFMFQEVVLRNTYTFCLCQERYMFGHERDENGLNPHSRRFFAFGIKGVEYPETEVLEYGAYQYARQATLQMLNGQWDDARGFLDNCDEDMVGMRYKRDVASTWELQKNLITDELLTLSEPLPSIDKRVKWKPIGISWENIVDRYKEDVQAKWGKKEWLEEFNQQCDQFYDLTYRDCGVKKFYEDYAGSLADFAEEIAQHIENRLFYQWENGEKSMLEVHKYVSTLVDYLDDRVGVFNEKASKYASLVVDDLEVEIKSIRNEWVHIGWLKDVLTNTSAKVFNRFADAKRDQLVLATKVEGYRYAAKLAAEIKAKLALLNENVIEPLLTMLSQFAEHMNNLSASKSVNNEVHDAVAGFLKDKEKQHDNANALRCRIIEAADTSTPSFTALVNKLNVDKMKEVTNWESFHNAFREMEVFSIRNPEQALIGKNILERLHAGKCSTPEKTSRFIKKLYEDARCLLSFSHEEITKGCRESAWNQHRLLQLTAPNPCHDEWAEQFIEQICAWTNINRKEVLEFSINHIALVNLHCGFPLRYLDIVRMLKESYDALTKNAAESMMVHSDNFEEPLPSLY